MNNLDVLCVKSDVFSGPLSISESRLQLFDLRSNVSEEIALLDDLVKKVTIDLEDNNLIVQVARHSLLTGGKRIRAMLMFYLGRIFGSCADISKLITLTGSVEFIHAATLLHDDVIDESVLRRDKATANSLWTDKISILVGDFIICRSFSWLVELGSLDILGIISNATARLVNGELTSIRNIGDPFDLNNYFNIIESKTAVLFASATLSVASLYGLPSKAREIIGNFGKYIGIAYQIIDDVLDYIQFNNQDFNKNAGNDFKNYKVTLPVIIAFNNGSESEKAFWHKCFIQQDHNHEDFLCAVQILDNYSAIEKAIAMAAEYKNFSIRELNLLIELMNDLFYINQEFVVHLHKLVNFMISRGF